MKAPFLWSKMRIYGEHTSMSFAISEFPLIRRYNNRKKEYRLEF